MEFDFDPFKDNRNNEESETITEAANSAEEEITADTWEDDATEVAAPAQTVVPAKEENTVRETPTEKKTKPEVKFFPSENTVPEVTDGENKDTSPEISSGKKAFKDFIDIIESVIVALVAAIFILTLFFRTGFVSGESMLTTMEDGDRYVVSGLFYTPQRGDIIVFEPDLSGYSTEEKLYVKRVIGIAGDHIVIKADKNDGTEQTTSYYGNGDYTYHLYLNGQLQDETYLDEKQETRAYANSNIASIDANGNAFIDLVVPDGYMFVMGDNRLNSTDSRILGCIDQRRIVGKILFRFFPFNKFGKVE